MTLLFYLLVFIFIGTCIVLSLLILMQESKSLGFGASFGGDSSSSVFGSSTADVVKKITGYLGVAFFCGCLVLTYWAHASEKLYKAPALEIESAELSSVVDEDIADVAVDVDSVASEEEVK